MAFRIAEERTITATVSTADGQDFTAEFLILSDDEAKDGGFQGVEGEKAFLRRVTRDLRDIEGADKQALPFSSELLEQVIGFADLRIAMFRAYNARRVEARRGN